MNSRTALFLAFRSYKPGDRKKKSSRPLMGAILGIALSLVPMIVVIHIADGMIEGITRRYIETYSYHLQIFSYASPEVEDYRDLANKINDLDDVESVYLERRGIGLAYSEEGKTGIQIRSIDEALYQEDPGFREYMEVKAGSFDLTAQRSIVLGEEVARQLQVQPGDNVKILTGKIFSNGRYVPRVTPFVVSGIVSSGYQELDRMWVFIPIEKGLSMLSDDSSETLIGIKTSDPYMDHSSLIQRISARAENNRNWRVYTWMSLSRSQQRGYQTTKMMLQVIMALLIVVAVINVSASLITLVMENSFEIGILKCIGASPRGVARVYRYIGLSAGVIGTSIGLTAGIILSLIINEVIMAAEAILNIFIRLFSGLRGDEHFELLNSAYYLQDIPITIEWGNMAVIAVATILLAWLASAIPARRAGGVRPLEVIRKH